MYSAIIFTISFLGVSSSSKISYDGYKVYEVLPENETQMSLLKQLQNLEEKYDFWSEPREVGHPLSIMVSPGEQMVFEHFLENKQIYFNTLIDNVEEIFEKEEKLRQRYPKVEKGNVTFTDFMRYDEIVAYLERLAVDYPNITTLVNIGPSYEGRDIIGLRISRGPGNKPEIFIDAGIHAREWIAPAMALYILNQLLEIPGNGGLFENVNWVIIPSLNPDGYEYCHTTERLWRKTRSPGRRCYGTDPNRNFDFHWMEVGASSNECSEIYGGTEPFSEKECQAFRDYVSDNRRDIKLYLTFHSYGQYIIYPWGWTAALPDDWEELQSLGEAVNDAISAVAGTQYTVGSVTNALYESAGGSDDWAKGVAGVDLTYTVELPGGGRNGFDIPATRIIPVVEETWEGVLVFHQYIEDKFVNSK